jgi:hypothetical protein|tara:strand:- start:667 stop:1008 length:342 start_codon:yes stop_codon:yes gene_type:complete
MKRLNNQEVNIISVIRTYDMTSSFYEVDAVSTSDASRNYSFSVGVHLPSNCKDFATVIVDLTTNVMESGEYIFGLKDVSGNGSDTVVEFLAIVGDNDRVTDAGTDVYGDSVIF